MEEGVLFKEPFFFLARVYYCGFCSQQYDEFDKTSKIESKKSNSDMGKKQFFKEDDEEMAHFIHPHPGTMFPDTLFYWSDDIISKERWAPKIKVSRDLQANESRIGWLFCDPSQLRSDRLF